MTTFNYSARAAYRLLRLARPTVTKRHQSEVFAMLDRVSEEDIRAYIKAKPKASTLYLGTLSDGKRGIALKIDRVNRVNPEWIEIPAVMRAYEGDNHIWDTVAA